MIKEDDTTNRHQARHGQVLIHDGHRVAAAATLSGAPAADREQLKRLLGELRAGIADAPADPYLLYPGRRPTPSASRRARSPMPPP